MTEPTEKTKKCLSNDFLDGLTAVALIAIAVGSIVYWLSGLPTS